jgi:hypothetical protein
MQMLLAVTNRSHSIDIATRKMGLRYSKPLKTVADLSNAKAQRAVNTLCTVHTVEQQSQTQYIDQCIDYDALTAMSTC